MTVAELVRLLAGYPPTLRVVVNGYEDGYDELEPEQVSIVKITLNTGEHQWEGTHGDSDGLTEGTLGGLMVRATRGTTTG